MRWNVPALPLVLGIVIAVIFNAGAYWRQNQIIEQQSDDRVAAASATAVAACESSNEFRRFMASYLNAQVGGPVNEAEGFESLPEDIRGIVLALTPLLEAGRENDAQYAAEFARDFPIRDCDSLALITSEPS